MARKTSRTLVGAPKSVGGYKIIQEIGSGGMGVVYLGRHEQLGDAAIKVIAPDYAESPIIRDRFLKEAAALQQVTHPGVVRIRDLEEDPLSLIMDYISGRSLRDHIEEEFPKVPEELKRLKVLKIVLSMAVAMSHAHRKGVIHRDLKPENIIIEEGNEDPMIIDFGICFVLGSPRKTQHGAAVGTPDYMAPEQMIMGGKIDNRTDIFALGLILYECITGRKIYEGHTQAIPTFLQLLQDEQFVPQVLAENLRIDHIAPIIEGCLRYEPENRYQLMDQVVGALELALAVEKKLHRRKLVLLTKPAANQRDVETVPDMPVLPESLQHDTAEVPILKKKNKLLIRIVGGGAALLVASMLLVVAYYLGSHSQISGADKAKKSAASDKVSGKPSPNRPAEETQTKGILGQVVVSCEHIHSRKMKNPYNLTLCIRRRAWLFFEVGEIEKAESLTKAAIGRFWKGKKWIFRKQIFPNFASWHLLLSRIYRIRAKKVKRYSHEWNELSREAARHEATADYWQKIAKKNK